jgi:hypothetical protein
VSEHERLFRGEKGDKGDRGEKGEVKLPPGIRKAMAYFALLNIAFFLLGFLWLGHIQNVNHASQVSQQTAQRKADQTVERKICHTLNALAANQPPPGNPATNPSRQYDQNNHNILDQLGPDMGCK